MSHPTATLINAGPLIALGKLNRLGLLAGLFSKIFIPVSVYWEVVVEGGARGRVDALHVRLFILLNRLEGGGVHQGGGPRSRREVEEGCEDAR